MSSVSVGRFPLLLKQSRLRYFEDAITFHLPYTPNANMADRSVVARNELHESEASEA